MEILVYKDEKGNPVTTSLLVAGKFEKRHDHVLDAIREILQTGGKRSPDFSGDLSAERSAEISGDLSKMFIEAELPDSYGRLQPAFIMNRDGFSLLVMGFTGEKALIFKLDFINAFNRMEQTLKALSEEKNRFDSDKIRLAESSTKRRYLLACEKRQLDARIEGDLKRRKEIVREQNQINFDDFQRLNLHLLEDDGTIPGLFPNQSKLLKVS